MNLDHLTVFLDLAETLNYRKTAERQNISQPAVSQSIKSVEREIGIKLFNRSRRGVKLTASGRVFYADLKPLMNSYYKSVQEARNRANQNAFSLTLGFTDTPYEKNFLPDLVSRFHRTYPKIKIYFQSYDHNLLKRQLYSQDCDLILATRDDFKDLAAIKYVPLLKSTFIAEIPNNNKLANKSSLHLGDFDYNKIILMDNNWCPPEQYKIQEEIRKSNWHLDISYVNNVSVSDLMVHCDLGITVMPAFISGRSDERVKKIPIVSDADLNYGLVRLKGNNSKAVLSFIHMAQSYFKVKEVRENRFN